MNFNLFLIIIIALIIIFCIILYNGLRVFLTVGKEKGMVKYEFKLTLLKIPIFKREDTKRIIDFSKDGNDNSDESKDQNEDEGSDKDSDENENSKSKDKKGLIEKYKEIKPILIELKKSKDELKNLLKKILKSINLKKLEGNLIIGLSDHASTVKIASWIWSIGAIVNSEKSTLLTVEPRFKEVILDFEGKLELKINLLILLIYSLILLTKKDIRDLIKELYRQKKLKDKGEETVKTTEEEKSKKEETTPHRKRKTKKEESKQNNQK